MNPRLFARLATLMFLQFFVWGAWYTMIAVYMANHGMSALTHWPYTVNPLAAVIAPFFVGFIADRYFATEKVLAILHLTGGAVMAMVPSATGHPSLFIVLLLAYNMCYMPTLALSSALVMRHLRNPEREFPKIRVFGTLGWIVSGVLISYGLGHFLTDSLPEQSALPLYAVAAVGFALGLYSLTLPATAPEGRRQVISLRSIVGLDALHELGSPSFMLFLASSLVICIPLAAYYNFTQLFLASAGFSHIAGVQTLGQVSEVGFMLIMPLLFARLGVKWMLVIGMGAWGVRYLLFSLGAAGGVTSAIVAGILLHGVCYDFFFVTGQIYVDRHASPAIRGQAQALFVLLTYGVGMLLGAQIGGMVYSHFLGTQATLTASQFSTFWLLPAALAGMVMIVFGAFFHDRTGSPGSPEENPSSRR